MYTFPHFIFKILIFLPFVGTALRRNSDLLEESSKGVDVPITNAIDCLVRLLLVVAIPVLALSYLVSKKVSEPAKLTNLELEQAFELDEDEFKEAIRGCKAEQLSEVVDLFTDDPSKPYDQRTALIRNRILAANKISKTRLTGLQIRGILMELELRSQLGMWNCERKIFDVDEHRDLAALAKLYESVPLSGGDERSEGLMEAAKVASVVSLAIGWVDDPKESETSTIQKLETKIESLRVPFLEDSDTGDRLTEMADIAKTRLSADKISTKVADRMVELIKDNYRVSEDVIRRNFKLLNCVQSASRFALKNNNDVNEGFIAKFQDKFSSMLKIKDLSDGDFRFLLEKISEIAESGWPNEAKSSMQSVKALIDESSAVSEETLSYASSLQERLSWVGQSFEFSGIKTLDGREVKFSDNGAVATFLLLLNNKNKVESNAHLRQMTRVLSDSKGKIPLNLAIALVHDDDKMDGLAQMRELEQATRKQNIRVWQINVNSDFWKEKLSLGIGMDEIPMILVFGEFDKIYAVNPNRFETDHIVEKLNAIKFEGFPKDG